MGRQGGPSVCALLPAGYSAPLLRTAPPAPPTPQTADFMAFDWRPELGSLLHVVPLHGGQVRAEPLRAATAAVHGCAASRSQVPPGVRQPPQQQRRGMPYQRAPAAHIHAGPSGAQVRTYRAPAFLASHWVNAFESPNGRQLHLDAIAAQSPALMSQWELGRGEQAGPSGGWGVPFWHLDRQWPVPPAAVCA